jgi:anaerobic selenocysteine-containing dehydrogenase
VRYIEGNRDHPVNRGVLCAKGSAGIMTQYSPARLTKPLVRVGRARRRRVPRGRVGRGDEHRRDLAGRDPPHRPAQARLLHRSRPEPGADRLVGAQFGTPNYAAHGGFCSVNMAAAGLYTIGGSFWEFGEPDWEHTRYLMLFGVAEDHASNPIKIGLGKLKAGRRRRPRSSRSIPVQHRLFRHRRRVARHPAGHRRAVRAGADPRAARRPTASTCPTSCATPTRPGW